MLAQPCTTDTTCMNVQQEPRRVVGACAHAHMVPASVGRRSLVFGHVLATFVLAHSQVMHLKRACEIKPGDQSVLNRHFRSRWHRLPMSIVTKWKGKSNESSSNHWWRLRDPAVLHFSSEPKP